ncbi:bifunctional lysylphosphatidylglycerol flippase/synthetase MprF [Nocardia sp. NPDC052566]|uniref:bifunctional lysylphosphatidylglycerol flippase/synthetase MprF n=1 Tax=Nocardia sp. NPDC052566 TaxID=3364330 RepID=UPI0037C8BBFB
MGEQRGIVQRNSTLTAYRETSFTTAPLLRAVLTAVLLVLSLVLVYSAVRGMHEGVNHSWFVAVSLAGVFVARGLHLRRPITLPHLTIAVFVLAAANVAYRAQHPGVGFFFLASSGFILVLPQSSRPQPQQLHRVAALVARTTEDPLAPFAMHSSKSYYFNGNATAAIAYRARFGIAVVAGDPIGDRAAFAELVTEFSEFAMSHGWRIAVLGASPELAEVWRYRALEHRGLHPVPIGRDVVIDVDTFAMVGRRFRNLRQAVSRTKNFGVSTEIVREGELPGPLRAELLGIVDEWHAGRQSRGFSMILDHLLDGRNPEMLIVLARDADGRVVGFQRYGIAGGGRELSLDVPWRRKDAPNGLDERMVIDLIAYAKGNGVQRISLAFAAFPELFADKRRSRTAKLIYVAVHLGDPLIRLESLYRYLRKFQALADQRYALIRWREVLIAAAAMLTLEFVPHRKQY